jgi:hypothetical protein
MKLRLPQLTPVAKGQLWGMGVGLGTALLATDRMGLSYGAFFLAGAAAWVLSERWLAPRLIGSDVKTLSLAIASGIAFPWVGWLAAFLLELARP